MKVVFFKFKFALIPITNIPSSIKSTNLVNRPESFVINYKVWVFYRTPLTTYDEPQINPYSPSFLFLDFDFDLDLKGFLSNYLNFFVREATYYLQFVQIRSHFLWVSVIKHFYPLTQLMGTVKSIDNNISSFFLLNNSIE